MFISVQFGCEEVKPKIVNTNVFNEVFLDSIKVHCSKEMEDFFRSKETSLRFAMDEAETLIVETKTQLAKQQEAEGKESMEKEEEDIAAKLKSLQKRFEEDSMVLEKLLLQVEKFTDLNEQPIDLLDSAGKRMYLPHNPKKRTHETLTSLREYSLAKIIVDPTDSSREEICPLTFDLTMETEKQTHSNSSKSSKSHSYSKKT